MKLENAHIETIKELKSAILSSRYRLAVLANSEMLGLYFTVGKLISQKIKEEKWGSKVLERLSSDLQNELPGLRGFSASNIKKMRIFYETWNAYFTIGSLSTNQFLDTQNRLIANSSAITNEFEIDFQKVSFTHHFEILSKTNSIEHYVFYIQKIASEFWSVTTLRYHLKSVCLKIKC